MFVFHTPKKTEIHASKDGLHSMFICRVSAGQRDVPSSYQSGTNYYLKEDLFYLTKLKPSIVNLSVKKYNAILILGKLLTMCMKVSACDQICQENGTLSISIRIPCINTA